MGITNRLNGKAWAKPTNTLLARISNKVAFLIAIVGGLITAAFSMLIPISTLEAFTGASGLSEIIPATGAPLGSSARTIFVIFTAILAASILLVLLLTLRKKPEEDSIYSDDDYVDEMARERNRMPLSKEDSELAEQIYQEDEENFQNFHQNNDSDNELSGFDLDENDEAPQKRNFVAMAGGVIAAGSAGLMAVGSSVKSKINKLPFMGGDDSIKSFDDLPKLRGADSHPDAPARRPLSAHEDLGERILDKEWDQEDASDLPEQKSDEGQIEGDQVEDDIYLQSQNVEETLMQSEEKSEASSPESIEAPLETAIDNNIDVPNEDSLHEEGLHEENLHQELTNENNDEVESVVVEAAISDNNELPTIDHLMGRLEALTERRTQRLQEKEKATSIPVESDPVTESNPEVSVKEETLLDDYTDVIDHVAIKRAEKYARENDEAMSDEKTVENIERPKATLVPAVSPDEANNGDTVVTKGQKAEMDNALKSALETLHKMTERSA